MVLTCCLAMDHQDIGHFCKLDAGGILLDLLEELPESHLTPAKRQSSWSVLEDPARRSYGDDTEKLQRSASYRHSTQALVRPRRAWDGEQRGEGGKKIPKAFSACSSTGGHWETKKEGRSRTWQWDRPRPISPGTRALQNRSSYPLTMQEDKML